MRISDKVTIVMNSLTSGGAERVVLSLLEHYRSQNIRVSLVLLEDDKFYPAPEWCEVKVLSSRSETTYGVIKVLMLPILAFKLKCYLHGINCGIVQSHMYRSNFVNILASLLGGSHKVQIVNHGLVSRRRSSLSRWVFELLVTKLYPFADQCISVSAAIKEEIQSRAEVKVSHIVHNPVDIPMVRGLSDDGTEAQLPLPGHLRFIVLAGRLIDIKRFDAVIKLLPLLDEDVELVVLGDGPMRDQLETTAIQHNVQARCHFMGNVDNPFFYFKRAACLVLPSESEGFPMVLIESMACETPVIATDCGSGAREIFDVATDAPIGDVNVTPFGVLVAVGDDHSLLKALRLTLNRTENINQIIQRGLQRANEFDIKKIGQRYTALIDDLKRK